MFLRGNYAKSRRPLFRILLLAPRPAPPTLPEGLCAIPVELPLER